MPDAGCLPDLPAVTEEALEAQAITNPDSATRLGYDKVSGVQSQWLPPLIQVLHNRQETTILSAGVGQAVPDAGCLPDLPAVTEEALEAQAITNPDSATRLGYDKVSGVQSQWLPPLIQVLHNRQEATILSGTAGPTLTCVHLISKTKEN